MPPPLADALAYLDAHVNFETAPVRRSMPTLDRIAAVCTWLGDPQRAYPVVHLTGTNGKGSTARMISSMLAAHGLSVGTYTSPHLESGRASPSTTRRSPMPCSGSNRSRSTSRCG